MSREDQFWRRCPYCGRYCKDYNRKNPDVIEVYVCDYESSGLGDGSTMDVTYRCHAHKNCHEKSTSKYVVSRGEIDE